MVLFLFFIFFLIFENLILPALLGPGPFLITPLFIMAMVIYSQDTKLKFIQAVIFLLIGELFARTMLGSSSIPMAVTIVIFIWLNHFLNIGSGLQESTSITSLLGGTIVLTIFICIYSYMSIFFQTSYSLNSAWEGLVIFIKTSITPTLLWAIVFIILFKYGLIKSK